jgi:acetyl-CoA carboxylase biotin carboxylase subunit
MITGIDLVQTMLRIAGGESLDLRQADVQRRGHAIECRINAEDPGKGFMPSPGKVTALTVPEGDGIRFDTMLYEGYTVPPFYDSLLGKLIVWDETREGARAKLQGALAGLKVGGIATTVGLHKALASDAEVAAHRFHTRWLEGWLEANPLSPSLLEEV